MKINLYILLLLVMPVLSHAQDSNIANGEKIYKANCSACHKPDRALIGPALKGVPAKYDNDWAYITGFVHNSQELVSQGDARAVKVFNEYNQQIMTSFPTLTEDDVKSIFAWADSFEDQAMADGMALRPLAPAVKPNMKPLYFAQNIGSWIFYSIGVIVIIVALFMATRLADYKPKSDENKA